MLAIGGDSLNQALFSFSFAAIFLTTVAFLLYYASKKEFYQFYSADIKALDGESNDQVSFSDIIKETWIFDLSLFINFFVTLGIFPTIPSLAESNSHNSTWKKYFVPVGCFLIFNVCDLLGRMIAGFVKWPKATKFGSIVALLFSLTRAVFIPMFMFCNVR